METKDLRLQELSTPEEVLSVLRAMQSSYAEQGGLIRTAMAAGTCKEQRRRFYGIYCVQRPWAIVSVDELGRVSKLIYAKDIQASSKTYDQYYTLVSDAGLNMSRGPYDFAWL